MSDFYQDNAEDYFNCTVSVEPSSFLTPLTKFLQPGARILDIGCGSGRDLLWLTEQGFKPTGFERSKNLARLARQYSQRPVIVGDFRRHDFSTCRYDALLLVGALVHLTRKEIPIILRSICQALKPSGFFLLTLKEGHGVLRVGDGRLFTLWTPGELEKVFEENCLKVVYFSRDISKLHSNDIWLSYILKQL